MLLIGARLGRQKKAEGVSTETKKEKREHSVWHALWPYIRQYRWLLLTAALLNAFYGLAVTFQTLMPRYLIDDVLTDRVVTNSHRWTRLLVLIVAYLLVSIVGRMLVWHISYRIFTYVREKIIFGLRASFFRHVNHLSRHFHTQHQSGELYTYLFGSPLGQVQNYFQQVVMAAPGAVFTLASTILWLGSWDWLLSGVLLLTTCTVTAAMLGAQKRIRPLWEDFDHTEATVTSYVADMLRGSRDVKLYAMEQKAAADFESQVWRIGEKIYQRDVRSHFEWMKNESINYACFVLMCAAITWRYLGGLHDKPSATRITIGQIQAYLTAFIALQGPLNLLFNLATLRASADAGMERIRTILETVSTTPDPVGPMAQVPHKGDIAIRNVRFGYETGRPVLRQLNLHIPYGQHVALVGASGAGKSTIAQLLLRLYDPEEGEILIAGVNIRHCLGSELRCRFGVVPQDPFIFRTNMRENLRVTRPRATDREIQHACELANAWEFVRELPGVLDAVVGEGGATLSGGQKQRLAIARALLAEPDYFILDEATSALDTISEQSVLGILRQAVNGRTALIIAHRIATVKYCDRIVAMEDGQVAQDGTYEQLLAEHGLFRNLVEGQVLRG